MSGNSIDTSMLDLFRQEVDVAAPALTTNLLDLEKGNTSAEISESLMRTAHSVKGAARMVGIDPVVKIAHIMEDCFVLMQNGELTFCAEDIDILLAAVDVISVLAEQDNAAYENGYSDHNETINSTLANLDAIQKGPDADNKQKPAKETNNSGSMIELFMDDSLDLINKLSKKIQPRKGKAITKALRDGFIAKISSIRSGSKLAGLKSISSICTDLLDTISSDHEIAADVTLSLLELLF